MHFFEFVAEEVRQGLASLGLRSLDELTGRADLLKQRTDNPLAKTSHLDLSFLTRYAGHVGEGTERVHSEVRALAGLCRQLLSLACGEVCWHVEL